MQTMRIIPHVADPHSEHAAPVPPCPVLTRRALLAGALCATAGLSLAACGYRDGAGASATPVATPFPAHGYPRPEFLADARWLAERQGDAQLRLLDCAPLTEYRRGHLPGARHVWWQDTIEINNPVYGMLVGAPGRAKLLDAAGVAPGTTVVCYDSAGGTYAARVIWLLHAIGFSGARLLDGGRQAWTQLGEPLTRAEPGPTSGGLPETPNEDVLAHGHDIAAQLGDPEVIVLDTRTAEERRETWNGALRRGVIPGSRWLPRDARLEPSVVPALLPPDELRTRLAAAGAPVDAPEIVVYGLHGTLAALPYLALRALGTPHARLYDGSWAEWGANTAWPVAAAT
jgi:thiosulfate/3-mercaptopyruvate sulfurtransferase